MMYNHHSYNDLIESKLSQLPQADASELWGGMQAILDKNMPEEKRKQRYFLWLFNRKGLVLMSDTRTNSGVDNVSVFRKMFRWEVPGERIIALMTAGNLAIP